MPKVNWKEHYELAVDERKALNNRVANALRYDRELNALEIAPNGGDYNALLEMICGAPYRNPHQGGR